MERKQRRRQPLPAAKASVALQGRTLDEWNVVAWELVAVEQLAQFHFNQFEQLFVVDLVALVQENNESRNANLTSKQDVLAGLWHGTVSSGHNQDTAVHLGSTGDHVLDVVGVSWAVNVGVVTILGFVLLVRSGDGDTARLFFWSVVDVFVVLAPLRRQPGSGRADSSGEGGLAVVNVADGADVDVRLVADELFLSHVNPFGATCRAGGWGWQIWGN